MHASQWARDFNKDILELLNRYNASFRVARGHLIVTDLETGDEHLMMNDMVILVKVKEGDNHVDTNEKAR